MTVEKASIWTWCKYLKLAILSIEIEFRGQGQGICIKCKYVTSSFIIWIKKVYLPGMTRLKNE